LGGRLDTLHNWFDSMVAVDPDGTTQASEELAKEYQVIHEESTGFNTECGIVGFNIPKFS
jgi:hypothetical protein